MNLALVPTAAKLLDYMEKHIPGLITVVLSLSAAHGHITPHCGGIEGFQFVRHHLAIRVPEPKARFRICGRVYEFEEGQLMGFNNSIPHEVINPSAEPRIVLLFDVLLPDVLNSPKVLLRLRLPDARACLETTCSRAVAWKWLHARRTVQHRLPSLALR